MLYLSLGFSCSYYWYSTKSSGSREELRQSVVTSFVTFFSTDLKDELLPELCLYPCNTCRVDGWVAVQHLQTFGIQLHDSQSGLSHLSQRLSVIAAGERKAMHASSLGQNHTITWKIYFFCMTHKKIKNKNKNNFC